MKDYVRCCNCDYVGAVKTGRSKCPHCKMEGTLTWVDDNMQEVPDNFKKPKWVCTDPDEEQYGRQLTPTIFEFKEQIEPFRIIQEIINLDDYTSEEMKEAYIPYGFPKGTLTYWLIAECLFEQMTGKY